MCLNLVTVVHRTKYCYANPVQLHEHRMMVRPLHSRSQRVLAASLSVSPSARIVASRDRHGNSVETATFDDPTTELDVVSNFRVAHHARTHEEINDAVRPLRGLPRYIDQTPNMAEALQRCRPDPGHEVYHWAHRIESELWTENAFDTMVLLMSRIRDDFSYHSRHEFGTQDPLVTLEKRSGTCRDFALLMIEATRSLGYPSRFVSGYLFDDEKNELLGGRSTHAWAQVHLPGAGWVDFDPTNDLVGGRNLIQSSIVLSPCEANPINGRFTGRSYDFTGMEVDVSVHATPYTHIPDHTEEPVQEHRTAFAIA